MLKPVSLRQIVLSRWLIAGCFLVASFVLFQTNNRFHFMYHPDENGKIEQLRENDRNMNHPLLMLTATQVVLLGQAEHLKPIDVAIAGRTVIALFGAASTALLALVAYALAGPIAAVFTGFGLMLNPLLFELSHYLKEDPALVFGLSACLLAIVTFAELPTVRRAGWLGVGTALAISGKYVGVLVLPLSIFALFWCRRQIEDLAARKKMTKWFVIGLLMTVAVCNYSVLLRPKKIFRGIERETKVIAQGHKGIKKSIPNLEATQHTYQNTSGPTLFGLAVFLLFLALGRKKNFGAFALLALGLLFYITISCSQKTAARYSLPTICLVITMAGVAGGWTVSELSRNRGGQAVALVFFAGWIYWLAQSNWPAIDRELVAFSKDNRKRFFEFVRTRIPPEATIAADEQVCLYRPNDWRYEGIESVPQHVISKSSVPKLGTIEDLKAKGIKYVAITSTQFGRFLRLDPEQDHAPTALAHRDFYQRLIREGKLLYSVPGGFNSCTEPNIRLYELR